jgi:hypothetical protein
MMHPVLRASLIATSLLLLGQSTPAQSQSAQPADRSYIGTMTEEQIRQKLQGEGFSEVKEVKKIPVTKYRWTAKAIKAGKEMDVTINELGHVSAK